MPRTARPTRASSIAPGRASRPALELASPAQHATCELEQVSKRFGDFVAVDDVSLEVERGEIFCLLGASGCGKTTLLRLLAGFETPSAGRLLIDGQDLAALPPYRRPVNMMFQSYALFPHMRWSAMSPSAWSRKAWSKDEIRAPCRRDPRDRAAWSATLQRKPHQLSGGQRQRVALARALVKRPKLLLLDEPLAALDRKLREHTQFELINIQQQLGVTFVVVTHDQEEAMTLATRIGVMNHGAIVQVGTPRQIYEFPATRFVADFIGSVNLFDGTAHRGRAGLRARAVRRSCPRAVLRRSRHHRCDAPAGAPLWVAVRPEKISLSRAAPETSATTGRGA